MSGAFDYQRGAFEHGALHELDAGLNSTPANDAGGRWPADPDWLDGRA